MTGLEVTNGMEIDNDSVYIKVVYCPVDNKENIYNVHPMITTIKHDMVSAKRNFSHHAASNIKKILPYTETCSADTFC